MKICDSFITSIQKGVRRERDYFYNLNQQSLILCGLVPLTIRSPLFMRFIVAETSAKTDYYVLSDDDCIPMHPDMILNGLDIINKHPEIGLLGFADKKGLMKKDLGSKVIGDLGGGIYEVKDIKGIRIFRKGILPLIEREWQKAVPDHKGGEGISDNVPIGEMIRHKGFKVALDTNNYYHDLGKGYSTLMYEKTSEIKVSAKS